jgi:hypothetical protein
MSSKVNCFQVTAKVLAPVLAHIPCPGFPRAGIGGPTDENNVMPSEVKV